MRECQSDDPFHEAKWLVFARSQMAFGLVQVDQIAEAVWDRSAQLVVKKNSEIQIRDRKELGNLLLTHKVLKIH